MRGRRSVSRVLSTVCTAEIVIHLGRPSPDASSNLPGSFCGPQHVLPYLVLLQPGFALPLPLPTVRCALTAPFHPYPAPETKSQELGGIFSAALSIGSRLPGVTWHPAHWSPDFPPLYFAIKQRLLGQLLRAIVQHLNLNKTCLSEISVYTETNVSTIKHRVSK